MKSAKPARSRGVYARTALVLTVLALALVAPTLDAQHPKPPQDPIELVRAAVANEVAAADHPAVRHSFRSYKRTPKGTQTRLYVETKDALAAMLIAINDRSLSPEQQQTEDGHLAWLVNNPEQLHKKQAREKEDAERTLRIVKALPDAFQYEYAGTEGSTDKVGKSGDELVRLKFTPNHSYSPPSHVEQALTGMEGYVLIDSAAKRLARIDGTLFRDVTFGWGFAGRLNKGGRFVVTQADVGDDSWDITQMSLNINGKILLFKNLTMVFDEVLSDFRRVPESLTFAQGVELLKAEQKLASDGKTAPMSRR